MEADGADAILAQLLSLGLADEPTCRAAIAATGAAGPDQAAEYIFTGVAPAPAPAPVPAGGGIVPPGLLGGGDIKLVIVVRADLRMSSGKVAAQAAHAALAATRRSGAAVLGQWQGAGEKIVVVC